VSTARPRASPLAPTGFERWLAFGAIILLAAVLAALIRGYASWARVPPLIWLHLATIMLSLALTPVQLLRPRGVRRHRQLGYLWVGAMTTTAALSFGIRTINPGGFSPIHVLSAFTLVQTPLIAWFAHKHYVRAHRTAVQAMVLAALLIAGFFTFPFGRMLGRWLFG
jgi:uncharacterized membrane protein